MARRFDRIKRGPELAEAFTNYKTYWDNALTRPRQIGVREPKEFRSVYVRPFGADLGSATQVVEARAQVGHVTTLKPIIDGAGTGCKVYTSDDIGTNVPVPFMGFKAARVIWQNAATREVGQATSKFTGKPYLEYRNLPRYSCAFGRNAETDNVYESFGLLKLALKARPGAINRVSLQDENITY